MLESLLVGDRQLLPALLSAAGKHTAAIGCGHSLTEAVLVLSFSARRLKSAFHGDNSLKSYKRAANMGRIDRITKCTCPLDAGTYLKIYGLKMESSTFGLTSSVCVTNLKLIGPAATETVCGNLMPFTSL